MSRPSAAWPSAAASALAAASVVAVGLALKTWAEYAAQEEKSASNSRCDRSSIDGAPSANPEETTEAEGSGNENTASLSPDFRDLGPVLTAVPPSVRDRGTLLSLIGRVCHKRQLSKKVATGRVVRPEGGRVRDDAGQGHGRVRA
jgi:hypothetical protein